MEQEHPLLKQMRRRMERVVRDATNIVIPREGDRVIVHIYTESGCRRPLVLK